MYALNLANNGLSGNVRLGSGSLCALPKLRRIDLSGNNISRLPIGSWCFPELEVARLSDMGLTGPMPRWVTRPGNQLEAVEINDNDLSYPVGGIDEADIRQLIARCSRGRVQSCDGLPPNGCTAFGDHFRPSSDGTRCIECKDAVWIAIVVLGSLFVLMLVAIVFFARLVQQHPECTRSLQACYRMQPSW